MTIYTDAQMVDDLAQQLYTSLTSDTSALPIVDFSDPKYDFTPDLASTLYTSTNDIELEDLTEVSLLGAGVFDRLMASVDLHIQREYKGNRITGDQYAKVYTEAMSNVLGSSVQFLLSKDQSHWAAITAQMQARIAEIEATKALVELETIKFNAQKTLFEMQNAGAQYALTKIQIASENEKVFLTQAQTTGELYRVENLLPAQTGFTKEQWESQRAQTMNTRTDGLTAITGILGKQRESLGLDVETKQFNLDETLPTQIILLDKQIDLLAEQKEAERSKTLNIRTDGTTIMGSVGKQKDLYTQQIDSFIKDAKFKTAKMYLDGWITQKTLDEALTAPSELTNIEINEVLVANRLANGL